MSTEPGGFHQEFAQALPPRVWDGFQLRVRDSAGKGAVLEVSASETVRDLKHRLEQCWGCKCKDQRLLYQGALMVDERSLRSYDLDNSSVVSLVPQLRLRHGSGINGGVGWNKSRGPGKVMPYDAPRGFHMIPGNEKWRPSVAGRTNVDEADLFFDSQKSPAPWEILSHDFNVSGQEGPPPPRRAPPPRHVA
mmetsp:Transcript_53922/g.101081  ORF Transcript_53922/g.101081 Transcript_53922/m.101081 type:complete len:192 (+) Transcript_53922:38-613(+)